MGALERILAKLAASKKTVPVENQDTGRTVYVLPETLKKEPDKFKKLRPDDVGDPRWRGKPKPPRKPQKPDKPEVPRDAPPAPIKPQIPNKRVKQTKPVTEVKEVKPPKTPKPSPPRRWKRPKKFLPKVHAASVVEKFLATQQASWGTGQDPKDGDETS